jgi:hypothetical protein
MKEKLKALGGLVLWIMFATLVVVLAGLFFYGAAWMSEKVLPILTMLGAVSLLLLIFIGLPLSFFKKCRGICATVFINWSYLCGLCLWMASLLVTINLWG